MFSVPTHSAGSPSSVVITHDQREVHRSFGRTHLNSTPAVSVEEMSSWWRSRRKRVFDFLCVFCSLPLLLPILLMIGIAVRLTSAGTVLFLQRRMGCNGRPFTILKFRTMPRCVKASHHPVTTSGNQQFTPIGPFLRRWKLDELPQLLNVLVGDMSLVGPRPKMLEHEPSSLPCRPGVTGPATLIFAREERFLDGIPLKDLNTYYHDVVLPLKRDLDFEYMKNATFRSDIKLILDSVLGRWDNGLMEDLLDSRATEGQKRLHPVSSVPVGGTSRWVSTSAQSR